MSDATILSAIENAAYEITTKRLILGDLFKRAHRTGIGWVRAHEAFQAGRARARADRTNGETP